MAACSVSVVALTLLAILRNRVVTSPVLPRPALYQLAETKGIELGNFAIFSRFDDRAYTTILSEQFNLALADNTPNWYFTDGGLRPTKDTYNFTQMDQVVNFAASHGMAVQAHHYVWGEEKWLPKWLKNGNYTPEQTLSLMQSHIQTVGKRYRGKIKEWTVVNEAFTRGQHIYGLRDWWADHTGNDKTKYIDLAFRTARQADSQSTLILNDFHNESLNSVSDEMYSYIRSARARGVPIDAIGMQMHIDGVHPPSKDEVIANMKRFGSLGVGVYVTEFDVNMNDVPASAKDKNLIEANIYYEMLRACIESRVCESFSVLGITDAETWYNYMGLKDPRPLPFDDKYLPKPAYYAMRRALLE